VSEPKPRIALVGHCGPDSYALRSAARRAVPEAEVEFITDEPSALKAAAAGALLLVNRVLDGDFKDDDGQSLINKVLATGSNKVMLISNFPDAQAAAEKAGALPGFGKTTMNADETRNLLKQAVTN